MLLTLRKFFWGVLGWKLTSKRYRKDEETVRVEVWTIHCGANDASVEFSSSMKDDGWEEF
jgi:hypothetical protein